MHYPSIQYELKPPKYCVDFWGNTIFGDAEWDDDDATCECSRKQWELGTIALQFTDCDNFDGDCETRWAESQCFFALINCQIW